LILSKGAATVFDIAPAKPPERKSNMNRLVLEEDYEGFPSVEALTFLG